MSAQKLSLAVEKTIRSLSSRKGREERGLFLVEGVRLVEEAFDAGAKVELILTSPRAFATERGLNLLNIVKSRGLPHWETDEQKFCRLAATETPQGVLAIVRQPVWEFHPQVNTGLWVITDGLQDPGNLGTIIRTAEAAGVAGIILTKGTVDPFNPKTLRATMGSVFRVPLFIDPGDLSLVRVLQQHVALVAALLEADLNYDEANLANPVAIVVGNEGQGISDNLRRIVNFHVRIPMFGEVESLNVAVAAAILLYESRRQHRSINF